MRTIRRVAPRLTRSSRTEKTGGGTPRQWPCDVPPFCQASATDGRTACGSCACVCVERDRRMCGIFGYVGRAETKVDVPGMTLAALKRLEYRGYDSWGIAVRNGVGLAVEKHVGKIGLAETTLPIRARSASDTPAGRRMAASPSRMPTRIRTNPAASRSSIMASSKTTSC